MRRAQVWSGCSLFPSPGAFRGVDVASHGCLLGPSALRGRTGTLTL